MSLAEHLSRISVGHRPLPEHVSSDPPVAIAAIPSLIAHGIPTNQHLEGCSTEIIKAIDDPTDDEYGEVISKLRVTPREKQVLLSLIRETEERLPQIIIEGTLLTVYSPEQIKSEAVVEVSNQEDAGKNSINDDRMGIIESDRVCATCHKTNIDCPGHIGIITLDGKFYHPLFLRTVILVLNCVCNSCGGLLLSRDEIRQLGISKFTGETRLKLLEQQSTKEGVYCRRSQILQQEFVASSCLVQPIGEIKSCIPNPIYLPKKSNDTRKVQYRCRGDKDKKSYERPIKDVIKILDAISDEDIKTLGFQNSHPRNFIVRVIPVVPPCIRIPNIRDGEIYPDGLSQIYKDVVKVNNELKNIPHANQGERNKKIEAIAILFERLVQGTDAHYAKGHVAIKSIKERLQGKKALIRGGIMGKRADYSSRSVIGTDPNLKFGQIGVPRAWAPYLTVDVTVTDFNRDSLIELLRQGRVTHTVYASGKLRGKKIVVNDKFRQSYVPRPGDRLSRWLQNGDYVIANRQPTLHGLGMMGHEVVLHDDFIIKLHMSTTTPYNADFDGDEMNLHAVQTLEARAEVKMIMNAKECVMDAQVNRPAMALVYDNLTAAYLLTQPDTIVDVDTYMDCLMLITAQEDLATLDQRLEKHHIEKFFGRALFSALLPGDFFYQKDGVTIIDGVLTNGIITKSHIGTTHGSIVQELWKRYGRNRTTDFLTDAPFVLNRWLDDQPFTVSLEDCYPRNSEHRKLVAEEITKAKMIVQSMGVQLADPLEEERREREVISYLNIAKDIGARVSKENLPPDNALKIMSLSGAKGSEYNIGQITSTLGQMFIRGKRMKLAISGGTRCLPYFEEGDLDPEARGFCVRSFMEGLTPAELFFHQAGSREGLMDTAIKTSDTGSLHHRIIKALEDIKVAYDGSTRDAANRVIQYVYGEDGFDGAELQFVQIGDQRIPSFINIDQVVGQINASYGYYPE